MNLARKELVSPAVRSTFIIADGRHSLADVSRATGSGPALLMRLYEDIERTFVRYKTAIKSVKY